MSIAFPVFLRNVGKTYFLMSVDDPGKNYVLERSPVEVRLKNSGNGDPGWNGSVIESGKLIGKHSTVRGNTYVQIEVERATRSDGGEHDDSISITNLSDISVTITVQPRVPDQPVKKIVENAIPAII
jgi:hypothetical protein